MENGRHILKLFSHSPFRLRLMLVGMIVALITGNAQAADQVASKEKKSLKW